MQADQHPGDRPLHEDVELPARQQQALPQRFLHHGPQDEGQQERARLEGELAQDVAQQPEARHDDDLGRVVLDREDPDRADHDHQRRQEGVGHAQQLHPQADQRQVEDEQHHVADVHRGDHPPEDLRVLRDQKGARLHALDHQRGEDHGNRRVARDPEREQRDERGAGRGVVGRLRAGDALDGPVAEALGGARDALLDRVGNQRGDQRPAPGEQPHQEADDGPARNGPPGTRPSRAGSATARSRVS